MSEPPKLEDDFCSIVVGGLISRASAEASGGLRGLRKLKKKIVVYVQQVILVHIPSNPKVSTPCRE